MRILAEEVKRSLWNLIGRGIVIGITEALVRKACKKVFEQYGLEEEDED